MYPWIEKGAHYSSSALKKIRALKKDSVKRILVIRHSAFGDMIQTRPFLYELRKLFPRAEIVLSIVSHYQYAAPTDLVDSVHVMFGQDMRYVSIIDKYKNIKEVGEFDLLFDLACTTRSHILSFFTRAKIKLGFPYKYNKWIYDFNVFRSDLHFEADILLEFLYLFGHVPEYPLQFRLPSWSVGNHKNRIVYFMGSSTADKNYPLNDFLQVLGSLISELPNYQHVVLQGIKEDEKFEKEIIHLLHNKNLKLQNTLKLNELAQFLSESSLVISNDTGVRNLAIGTHTPTVGIFGVTVPYRVWPRYESHHDCVFGENFYPKPDLVIARVRALLKRIYP